MGTITAFFYLMAVSDRARARGAVDGRGAANPRVAPSARGKALGANAANASETRGLLRTAEVDAKAGQADVACEAFARAAEIYVRQGFARRALAAFAQGLAVAREAGLSERVLPLARAMGNLYVSEQLIGDAVTILDGAAGWLIERGFDASALPLLEDRVALDDSDVARVRLGEAYFRLGEADKGADALAVSFHRLRVRGRRDEALDVAERLLGERKDVEVARKAAELYLSRRRPGDPFLALAKLRLCCDADPSDRPTLELLARAFDLAGHGEKADRVRREIGFSRPPSVAAANVTTPAVPFASPLPPRPTIAPPRVSAIRPKAMAPEPVLEDVTDPSTTPIGQTHEDSIECAWDDLVVEEPPRVALPPPGIDPSRPSFWHVPDAARSHAESDSGENVVSLSLADVELIDGGAAPASDRSATILETALECIESLSVQGRYEEAAIVVARHLAVRPRNRLLLDRKRELEELLTPRVETRLVM
jgi:hypothetical protein